MRIIIPVKLFFFSALFLVFNSLSAQDFTWIKGSNSVGVPGDYGSIGVPAASNNPGGREGAAIWKDAAGNFWMFGGNGHDDIGNFGPLSDLWKYNPTSNQWVYVKGNDLISQPGVYGFLGVSSPFIKPGGRYSSASWTDGSGNLWLFGGYGYAGGSGLGYLNDLWKYNITTNEWTYMKGASTCYQPGNYGTIATPSSSNTPGARMGSVSWADPTGNLWLFGGYGNTTSSTTIGSMNDVWNYNVTTNEWTWMKGSQIKDQNGVYGTLNTPAMTNSPGSRAFSTGWTDGPTKFYMLGGDGWDATATVNSGLLNDFWEYDMINNEWTWIKGSNSFNQQGVYGLQGISNALNLPGSRSGSVSWKDAVGNLWLFGGEGNPGSASPAGGLNDLWKYNLATGEWTWVKGTALTGQAGIYGTQTLPAYTNLPGARTTHSGWIDNSNDLYLFGGYGQAATSGTSAAGNLNDLWKYMNCYISPITMTIVSQDSSICAGESTSLTASGASSYLWSHNLALTSYVVIQPTLTTTYTVVTADTKGCRYTATFTETVSTCAGIEHFAQRTSGHYIYPNPAHGTFNISVSNLNGEAELLIFNGLGQFVYNKTLFAEETTISTDLPKGIYYYLLKKAGENTGSGKIIIE